MDRSTNPAYAGHAIDLMEDLVEADEPQPSSCKAACRNIFTCIRVSPWVPLIGAIMIATGLPVWAIYTRRALGTTQAFADSAFGGRTYAIDQLTASVGWVTMLAVIIVASVVGLCLLLSLGRTYQETARLPQTKCAAPGKLSYGSYAGLISIITFGLWLMTIVVSLLIAAQLCWLLLAFIFEQAIAKGVTPSNAVIAPAAFRDATNSLLASIKDAAGMPKDGPLAAPIKAYQSAAKQATISACPASCMSFGSFAPVFGASAPCMCAGADQYYSLLGAASDTWRHLVHALAALALMGLADLWLLMNLSAQFAHAKRDIADIKRAAAAAAGRISDDATGAVYVTTNPAYRRSPEKQASSMRRGDTHVSGRDTPLKTGSRAAPAPAPAAPPSPAASARAAPEMLPDSVIAAAPIAGDYARGGGDYAPPTAATNIAYGRASEEALRESSVIAEMGGSGGGAVDECEGAPLAGGSSGGGASGGGSGAGRQQFNTTAQRYAAYRLRAAQAANANKTPERAKWAR